MTRTEILPVESICPQKVSIVLPVRTGPITVEEISEKVSNFYDISIERMQAKTRKREVVQARQISMYFSRDFTKNSLKTIGEYFGGRDHTSVIHSLQTVNDLMDSDPVYREHVGTLRAMIW